MLPFFLRFVSRSKKKKQIFFVLNLTRQYITKKTLQLYCYGKRNIVMEQRNIKNSTNILNFVFLPTQLQKKTKYSTHIRKNNCW